MSFMGLPPLAGFAAKAVFMVPTMTYGALFVSLLWVSVVMRAAAYLTASIGALFMTVGTAS
jgi:NADH:ubiquinone oxidoreductase subunit 2 (subunit N)